MTQGEAKTRLKLFHSISASKVFASHITRKQFVRINDYLPIVALNDLAIFGYKKATLITLPFSLLRHIYVMSLVRAGVGRRRQARGRDKNQA